jgi:hypothetical protein
MGSGAERRSTPVRCYPGEESVLFQNRLWQFSVATDQDGHIVWYLPRLLPYLTRPQPGGRFFALHENAFGGDADQLLQEIDLAGNVIWETSAAAINEQLERQGVRRINSFHHEARRLPDGRILVLASNERLVRNPAGEGEIDVLGDAILVLNQDLQVEWFWDAFDHLDVSRRALQNEICVPGGGGCPVFHLAEQAHDWLHGNSLSLTPDGNLLYSARHQDWVLKIEFANGSGSGQVMWRLGHEGDFQAVPDTPQPWFSHQHDANFVQIGDAKLLLLYDNSNARALQDPGARSRGQLIEINDDSRTARLVLNVNLGVYAFALGSAQMLENGNFLFLSGIDAKRQATVEEFTPDGVLVQRYDIDTPVYRVQKMRNLYTP